MFGMKDATNKRQNNQENEVMQKSKRVGVISSGIIGFIICALVVALFNVHREIEQSAEKIKPTIALVNEDQDGIFNETTYNFGKTFIDVVANDSKYNWQTASRSVADRAYADESVQAVIYLPQNFTNNILTLEAMDPQKAQVDYKVLTSQSELDNQIIEHKIVDILYDFNTSIVKMYYGSVADNVASAQTNMESVVNDQGGLLTNIKTYIQAPFDTTNKSYGLAVSVSNALKGQNASWITAQNTFTTNVVDMLTKTSKTFADELPQLTEYFATQKQIMETNVVQAQDAIDKQADDDKTFYQEKKQQMYDEFKGVLTGFKSNGLGSNYQKVLEAYNGLIKGVQNDVNDQINLLEQQEIHLVELEQTLYHKFFAQTIERKNEDGSFDLNKDFASVRTVENARTGMEQLLTDSFAKSKESSKINEDNLTEYQQKITDALKGISVNKADYAKLFEALKTNGALTAEQIKTLSDELTVLYNYAKNVKAETAEAHFEHVPNTNTTNQTFTKEITVVVPAGKKYNMELTVENGELTKVYAADGDNETVPHNNGSKIILDNTRVKINDESANLTHVAPINSMTYVVTYEVSLGAETEAKVTAKWGEVGTNESTQMVDIFALIPNQTISDYVGKEKFGDIMETFQRIKETSSLVTFLYGKPGANLAAMKSVKNYDKGGDNQSIYRMYKDMSNLGAHLQHNDVVQYQKWGTEHIKKVKETLDDLNQAKLALKVDSTTLKEQSPNNYFSTMNEKLDTWYSDTIKELEAKRNQEWEKNEVTVLPTKPWSEKEEEEIALYQDQLGSEALYERISVMITESEEQATETANTSQIIKDNTEMFEEMVKTIEQTQEEANEVIEYTENVVKVGTEGFAKNQVYAENFSGLLANTRAEGVDSNRVFSFFAHPLSLKNRSVKDGLILSIFDWRPLLVFAIGLFSGMFVLRFGRIFKRNVKE